MIKSANLLKIILLSVFCLLLLSCSHALASDMENLTDLFRKHIADHTGHDNDRNRNRHDSAEFLRQSHADGCGDGLRKQCDILLMIQSHDNGQDQHT